MTRPGLIPICLGFLLGASQLLCGSLGAEPLTNELQPLRLASTNLTPASLMPPVPAPIKSPVDQFRELLAMTPGERVKALAGRSPESRRLILSKVFQYQALSPTQRELRLQATDLRWYLWPLMNSSSANRAAQLERIPSSMRSLVEPRLQEWDRLPPALQKQLLTNEATIRYFAELANSSAEQKTNLEKQLSPQRLKMLQNGVKQLQNMPDDQRQVLLARFSQFFDLTSSEKSKALGTLSEPERQQIEKTLRQFGHLSPPRRAQCLRGMEKFVSLSLAERQQFLKNAERWKTMTPEQRQAWCDLISKLEVQPPSPPALFRPPLLPVPRPHAPKSASAAPALATNQN